MTDDMTHDFKKFPELTDNQMNIFYFDSPHRQIAEDFTGRVVKVHDGDTISIKTGFRDFNFPIRMANLLAPELSEKGGYESRDWLSNQILNEEVQIIMDKDNRVGKYGRLIGKVMFHGADMGQESITNGFAIGLEEERGDITELILKLGL